VPQWVRPRLDLFLAAWPVDVPVTIEVRNKAWMTEALAECLRRHNAVWVLADQVCPARSALSSGWTW
jgi:hypothetical protein